MTAIMRNLTAAAILKACSAFVPVNTVLDAAIEAHRTALACSIVEDEPSLQLAGFALRAVILARTSTREEHQRQFDYLAGLPERAWEDVGTEHRDATLVAIARSIAWFQLN